MGIYIQKVSLICKELDGLSEITYVHTRITCCSTFATTVRCFDVTHEADPRVFLCCLRDRSSRLLLPRAAKKHVALSLVTERVLLKQFWDGSVLIHDHCQQRHLISYLLVKIFNLFCNRWHPITSDALQMVILNKLNKYSFLL